jgi:hypothetical protein
MESTVVSSWMPAASQWLASVCRDDEQRIELNDRLEKEMT